MDLSGPLDLLGAFRWQNLTEFYEKNNLFVDYTVVSLADIFSCIILASVFNRVVNCKDEIKNFRLRQDFSSFGMVFIRILPKLSISIMKSTLVQDFRLASLLVSPFCGPALVIQSSICWCSASDKRYPLEALLLSSIKPNATRVSLLNCTIWGTDEEEDVLFMIWKSKKAGHDVGCAGAIF